MLLSFIKKGKLSPKYIGPYQISKRIGKVAYVGLTLRVSNGSSSISFFHVGEVHGIYFTYHTNEKKLVSRIAYLMKRF